MEVHIFARLHLVMFFFAGSFGPSNGHPIGHPYGPRFAGPIDPGGIEPQPIKLEFTIYPAELWI